MESKKVSIIIPIYNEEKYLYACVNSVLQQTYKNLQIILVDDGSKQNVAEDCDKFAENDERIVVIHKKNSGLSAARISGLEVADGEYIFFVDDDDLITRDAIQVLVGCDDGECDIITARSIDLKDADEYKNPLGNIVDSSIYTGQEVCEWMATDKERRIITPLWGKLYKREYIKNINVEKYKEICPTIFFEDVLMTPILYREAKKISVVDRVIYIHRELETSISHMMKLGNYYYEQIESGNILLEYCKEKNIPKMFQFELEIYYRVLLRIYCLIDKEEIGKDKKKAIKDKIVYYYKKYYNDMIQSTQPLTRKILYSMFMINKQIWARLVRILYFGKR